MDLSIVILFSDNDYKRLPKLIQSIKDNIRIKGKYEIIVSDNRDKFKNENLEIPENIIISDNKGNVGASEGRRLGLNKASGKYVWFIDADDEVLKLNKFDLSGDYDCFQFDYQLLDPTAINSPRFNNPLASIYPKEVMTVDNLRTRDLSEIFSGYYNYISSMLWDKFLKVDILKKAFDLLPKTYLSIMEDTVLLILFFKNAKSVKFSLEKIILYHNEDKTLSLEKLKALYKNYGVLLQILRENNTYIGHHTYDDRLKTITISDCLYWHLYKAEHFLSKKDFNMFSKYLIEQSYKYMMSVIVPFGDNHWQYIPRLLKNLKECIPVSYQVILVSNCSTPIELGELAADNIVVLNNNGTNLKPFNSRRLAAKEAEGMWTWFVDADDLIKPIAKEDIEKLYTSRYDVYNFATEAIHNGESKIIHNPERVVQKDYTGIHAMGYMITNKWINTDFLRDTVLTELENVDISFFRDEDLVLLTSIVKNIRSERIMFLDSVYYIYNTDNGTSDSLHRDINWLKTVMSEISQKQEIYHSFLSNYEMAKYGIGINAREEFLKDTDTALKAFYTSSKESEEYMNEHYEELKAIVVSKGEELENEKNSHIHYL